VAAKPLLLDDCKKLCMVILSNILGIIILHNGNPYLTNHHIGMTLRLLRWLKLQIALFETRLSLNPLVVHGSVLLIQMHIELGSNRPFSEQPKHPKR